MKRKERKLTRLILAALMCAGGAQLVSPGVASANAGVNVTTDTTISDTTYAANDMVLAASNIALTIASGGKVNAIRTDNKNYTGNTIRVQGTVTNGAACIYGGVKDMKVYIENGATVNGSVYAGNNAGGAEENAQDATNNLLDISGGTVGDSADDNLVGGLTYGSGNASENTVNISGGTIGNAENATPIMIAGGWATSTKADKNTVNISGGTIIATVNGGAGKTGASDNNVNITGGTINGTVIGGQSSSGNATGNTVTISNGTINGMVMGGMAPLGNAIDNTVNILASMTLEGINGGTGSGAGDTGNTINFAAKDITITDNIYAVQNLNFYLPQGIAANDTMVTVQGGDLKTKTDLKGVAIGAAVQAGASLVKGDAVNLITNPNGLTTDSTTTMKQITDETVTIQTKPTPKTLTTDQSYELELAKTADETTIVATVKDVKETPSGGGDEPSGGATNDGLKSPVETRAAVTTFVNAGADMLASQGFAQAANAVALDMAESAKTGAGAPNVGGFTPFAAFGGSSMRAESGSHVDTKGFGLNIGFARELPNSQGKLLFGPVVEYGGGSYDSYNNDVHGEGGAHYFGVGLMARQVNHDGFYYEGSVRGGRVTSDYKSFDVRPGKKVEYDSSSNYWAAHLGVGKVFAAGKQGTVDGYLKYFYSHQGGDDTDIKLEGGAGERVSFDAINSNRIRIGARYTHKINEMNSLYGGLAYQYEFGGEARAHYYTSGVAPSPSIKGSSGMLELGWQVKPGGPVTIDLGVTGWAGKQRGGSVQLGATWSF